MEEEGLFAVLEDIAVVLKRTNDLPIWKKTLSDNLFESCSCFKDITAEDWLAMKLPLNLLVELRKVISKKKIISRKLVNKTSKFPDLSVITQKQSDEKKSRSSTSSASVASKKKKSSRKTSTIDDKRSIVQLVGNKDLSSFLLHQILGDSKLENEPNIYKIELLGNQITTEIHEFSKSQLDYCSCVILLFENNNLSSLGDLLDAIHQLHLLLPQSLPTTMRRKFQTPLLLVGVDVENKNTFEVIPSDMIKESVDGLGAIRYFQVTNNEESKEVFVETAKILLRSFAVDSKVESAVHKNTEKRAPELILKNSSISILPNCFYQISSHLFRLCLSGNLFKDFPTEVLSCKLLQDLDLSFNQIPVLPNDISNMKSLIRFDMDNNLLEFLPIYSLKKLQFLKELKVKNNPLSKLPASISKGKGDLITLIKEFNGEEVVVKLIHKIFTVPLQSIMAYEYANFSPSNPLPRFFRLAINYIIKYGLDQEGIFRLAGQNVQCIKLREDLENGEISSFSANENVHNVTSLLKQFLRDLPEPLFPFSTFDQIISFNELGVEESVEKLKEVLGSLPKENYHAIRQIFRLMYLVSRNANFNRMDDGNITKVIAPNILYSNVSQDQFASMTLINTANDILTPLVSNYPLIFEDNFNLFDIDFLQDSPPDKIMYRKEYGHKKSVVSICVSADQKSIWSVDSKGVFRIWDSSSLTLIKEVDTNKKRINCIAESGGYMWLGTSDSLQIRHQSKNNIEREQTGELIHEIEGVVVYNFASINGSIWVGDANVINCYTFEEDNAKKTLRAKNITTDFMAVNMVELDGNIWMACADRKIRVLNPNELEMLAEFDSPQGRINSLDVVGNRIWTSADNCSVFVWDSKTFECVAQLEGKHTGKVFGAVQVGNSCWTFAWNGEIHVYHSDTFEYLGQVFSYHSDAIAGVAKVYDEGKECYRVYTASWDKSIILWLVKPN